MLDPEENQPHPGIYLLDALLESKKYQQLATEADLGHAPALKKMDEISGSLQSLVFYLEATEVGHADDDRVNYELAQFQELVKDYLE